MSHLFLFVLRAFMFSLVLCTTIPIFCRAGRLRTVAGTFGLGGYSGDGGSALSAQLNSPYGIAVSGDGEVYIADSHNNRIRKVLKNGNIITIAGTGTPGFSGDGESATYAQLISPRGVVVSGDGEVLFADNHRIRKIMKNGNIMTLAGNGTRGYSGDGGPALKAQLDFTYGVAVSRSGEVYFPAREHHCIRKILLNGTIITIAGNGTQGYLGDGGPASESLLYSPHAVSVSRSGEVYIADSYNNRIRKILLNGTIITIAGNGRNGYSGDGGPATSARIYAPDGVAVSSAGEVYIADTYNHRIRKVLLNGTIITIAMNGTENNNSGEKVRLEHPRYICVSLHGEVYIADSKYHRVTAIMDDPFCYGKLSTDPEVCAGKGTCVSSDICLCNYGYGGYNCSATICYGFLSIDPGVCSDHGACVSPNNCSCFPGFGALDCSDTTCDDILSIDDRVCSGHGSCIAPNNCSCDNGYVGSNCSTVNCYGIESIHPDVCSGNGRCIRPEFCECHSGYAGANCSDTACYGELPTSYTVCSGHGECISSNNCSCSTGYDGADCSIKVCHGIHSTNPEVCSGHGSCISPNNCSCDDGYGTDTCLEVSCYGILRTDYQVCANNGTCVGPNNCSCRDGFGYHDCSIISCHSMLSTDPEVCSGHGSCISPNNCSCHVGYGHKDCSASICYGKYSTEEKVCSGHGICISPDNCSCDNGYGTDTCSDMLCYGIISSNRSVCSGHGNCSEIDSCSCFSGYTEKNCSEISCYGKIHSSVEVCSGHGKCTGPNQCSCYSGYRQSDCSTFTESNTKLVKRTIIPLSMFAICSLVVITSIIVLLIYKQKLKKKRDNELQAKLLDYEMPEIDEDERSQKLSTIQIGIDELTFSSKISEGAGGTVYKGLWYNRTIAIKRLKVGGEDSFIREVSVLNRLRHPNVIALYGYCIDHSDNKYIVTEFVDGGSLDSALYSNKLKKFESKISALLDIAQGMHYLHSRNPKVLHMDIKPQNVLVQDDNTCKLCDFGVSKITDHSLTVGVSYGTWQYMCPELLSQSDYDEKCDVFSFGIMMHEVFTLEKPYMSSNITNPLSFALLVLQGKRPFIPSCVLTQHDNGNETLIAEFFYKSNELKHEMSEREIGQITIKFFQLCVACWSQYSAERPNFDNIIKLLKEIRAFMNQ